MHDFYDVLEEGKTCGAPTMRFHEKKIDGMVKPLLGKGCLA